MQQHTTYAHLKRGFALPLILLLACAAGVSAQVATGTLKGKIVGPDGGAIGGARVSVVANADAQNTRTVTSSAAGDYSIADLAPGLYKVRVEVSGFKTVVAEDIDVLAGDAQELRFTLEPGDPQETVVISPETPPQPHL
ncbi:MAG TPA: carboxypeptidase-like regulatory domain-containing protein [Pyrinomonadaceae bacterium]|jgi:hypothetical protein